MAPLSKRLGAEFLGTFWLVFAGCGSAVLAATASTSTGFPVGIGYLGVALSFGLSVVTMAYAVGGISGGHFNPAVTLGVAVAGRFEWEVGLADGCTQFGAGRVGGGVERLVADALGLAGAESVTGLLRQVVKSHVNLLSSGDAASDDVGLLRMAPGMRTRVTRSPSASVSC